MQQVHAVGDPAELDQGSHGQHPGHETALKRPQDQADRAGRDHEEPDGVHPGGSHGGHVPEDDRHRETDDGQRIGDPPCPGRPEPDPSEQGAGEQRPGQQLEHPAEGAEVGRVEVGTGEVAVEGGRGDEPDRAHGDHRPDRPPAAASLQRQQAGDDQRQQHVELLLDRQAPEVLERRRRLEGRPVAAALGDEVPVDDLGQGERYVAAQIPQLVGVPDADQPHGHDDADRRPRRRQQPTEPPDPEAAQVHRVAPHPLAQQQRRDEEAREREEEGDAEEPTGRPAEAGVVHEHGGDRDRPEPVEGRMVTQRSDPACCRTRRLRAGGGSVAAPSGPSDDPHLVGGGLVGQRLPVPTARPVVGPRRSRGPPTAGGHGVSPGQESRSA